MLYVLTGPPASGKSSYIAAHAKPGDIVIDLDRIALALTAPGAPQWQHSDTLLKVAHRARFAALDEALKHHESAPLWLIHTMPSPKALAKYRRHKAKIITVDPGEAIVRQRVRDMRHPGMDAVVTRWYRHHRKGGSRPVTGQASRTW